MTRLTQALAAALLVGAAPAACPASAAHAATPTNRGLTIRLVDEPTALKDDPRASTYVIDQLAPGATITRHVEVTNDTGASTTVSLYPSAATVQGGGFVIGNGAEPSELTGWTTITPASMPLAAGAKQLATVTIAVPADAASGERYEGLVAALPAAKQPSGLALENRVAIRTYLSVSSGAHPVAAPDFTIGTLQAERLGDGTPAVVATVTNTGGRALDLTGTLSLTHGPGGLTAGPYATEGASTLAPGASGQVFVALDKQIPAGPWDARIDVRSGLLVRSATGTITFPSTPDSKAAPVAAKPVPITRNRGVVGLVAGLLLGLVVVGLLFVLWRRRRRDEDEPVTPERERATV